MFDLIPYEARMQAAYNHFEDELKKVRTGRAHPGMLDGIMVEAYNALMPLNQLANVTVPEPQLLQITPFDPSQLPNIVAAIKADQTLSMNPSDDGRLVRVPVPPLTTERRQQIVKLLGEKIEDCRIALRNIRQDALKDVKNAKNNKEITEDDQKRTEKQLDVMMSNFQAKIAAATTSKEKEIMTI